MTSSSRILVTGGLSGIGRGVVEAFSDRCDVWSRRTGVDLTDIGSVERAFGEYRDEHGAPFALVHCVGDFDEQPILASDLSGFRAMIDSNLTSAFVVARAVVPAMVEAGRGRVLFFAAAGVDDGGAKTRAPLYFAAKSALSSLARSLAAEVAGSGVCVNVISPGLIAHASSHAVSQARMAARVPLGRMGTVGDVVAAVEYLLSDTAGYVTGQNLAVDGGLSL